MSGTTDHLQAKGVEFETLDHGSAFTTVEEARALGIDADGVAKTLLLHTSSGLELAVVCGDRRLDMHLVEQATGDKHAHLAKEDEIQGAYPGMELGCLPPLPSLLGVSALVDPAVMEHETIVFAAGKRTESVKARTSDVFRDEPITVTRISAGASEG